MFEEADNFAAVLWFHHLKSGSQRKRSFCRLPHSKHFLPIFGSPFSPFQRPTGDQQFDMAIFGLPFPPFQWAIRRPSPFFPGIGAAFFPRPPAPKNRALQAGGFSGRAREFARRHLTEPENYRQMAQWMEQKCRPRVFAAVSREMRGGVVRRVGGTETIWD